jgi:hypothetical protein
LRIRQGNEVEIHLPMAPSTITLWHDDVDQARWMEEGSAQRTGTEYFGGVKHFSFWSFSTAFNLVELKGKVFLVDDQHPLAGAVVRLTMTSDSVGDLISGMFDGSFGDQLGFSHTLSGTYQVRRDY